MEDDETKLIEDLEIYGPRVQRMNLVVNVLSVSHMIYGILAIVTVVSILNINLYENPLIITVIILVNIAALIIALPIFSIIAWGIWSLQPWTWKYAGLTNLLYLIVTLLGSVVLPAMLNIIFILMLYSTDVRNLLQQE